jgi:1-deoxy-D-xylulose-5-phosphate reductoisomerase
LSGLFFEGKMQKGIAVLGSTGSIGTQTLEVIQENPELFRVEVLTAGSNGKLLLEQAKLFRPNVVVIQNEAEYYRIKDILWDLDIKCYCGAQALNDVVQMESVDLVLTALVGFAGLEPTVKAIEAKKTLAIANKETLVVAGELITKLAKENGVAIMPVDSEHSAIFQCLVGEWQNPIEKIILTASGGPFRTKEKEFLQHVTPAMALKHPNWEMGAKITIDSSTLMNKGLEVIEAKWLFNLKPEQIDVVVHPESIAHSFVQFEDGSVKAQLGLPDMKLPILFAMAYPKRVKTSYPRMDLAQLSKLNFEEPRRADFPCLDLAFEAMHKGGFTPCILNAANEIVVEAFLQEKIPYLDIPKRIKHAMDTLEFKEPITLENLITVDRKTREFVSNNI